MKKKTLSEKFGITNAEISNRKEYIELDEQDARELRGIFPTVEQRIDVIIAALYDHISNFPAAQAFFADETKLAHAKSAQRDYLLDLVRGEYDSAYIERRLQIGVVHERIGLDPRWYLGSYNVFWRHLTGVIWRNHWFRPKRALRTIRALFKIINFDQQLVMDTYIYSNIESLAEVAKETAYSVANLTTSANETAISLNQTSATTEELRGKSKQAAELTEIIKKSSADAVRDSNAGEQAAQMSVEQMRRIQDQMKTMSQSILELSAKSHSIAKINDSIKDLAEQSHLLGVNAAVEAAHAGEAGKGFTVVAQAIGELAQKSKDATVSIKEMLDDIQNATTTAVMSTEQCTREAKDGVNRADECGTAIRDLAKSINKSSGIATEIATAFRQQSLGIDQIGLALGEIKSATDSNMVTIQHIDDTVTRLNQMSAR